MDGFAVLGVFFFFLFLGVPVAYTMILSSGLYFLTTGMSLMVLMQRMGGALNSITLLAVPTFIFAGCIMNAGGLTDNLFAALCTLRLGKTKGGLAHINVVASLIFAGMSGAALADLGGLGNVEMKAMRKNGYSEEDAIGITLASSAIGPIFPPSIPLLIFSLVASVSGIKILLAGIIPGILLTLALMGMVVIFSRTKDFPRGSVEMDAGKRRSIQLYGIPALIAPIILLAGLFPGTFSPTELASAAVVYSFFVGLFFYRKITPKSVFTATRETTDMISNTMFIMGAATVFAFILTVEQIPNQIQALILGVTSNKYVLLLLINLILLVVGMVMDVGISIMIFTPIFLPILTGVGVDAFTVGVMMVLNLVMGMYTPPFGTCLFMASTMTKRPVEKIVSYVAPYYIPLVAVLILIAVFPPVTTWLPGLFG